MDLTERFLTEGEDVRMTFRAHWRSGLMGIVLTLVLGIGGFWLGTWLDASVWGEGEGGAVWGGLIGLGIGLAIAILGSAGGLVEWLTTRYWITTERLIVRTGWLTKSGKEIPVDAINSVTVKQGPFERMLGYGDMTVESAGEGSLQVFRNVPRPTAVQKAIYDAREDRTMYLSGASGRTVPEAAPRGRYADLADLAELRDSGHLTEAEFEAEKAKLLGDAAPEEDS